MNISINRKKKSDKYHITVRKIEFKFITGLYKSKINFKNDFLDLSINLYISKETFEADTYDLTVSSLRI